MFRSCQSDVNQLTKWQSFDYHHTNKHTYFMIIHLVALRVFSFLQFPFEDALNAECCHTAYLCATSFWQKCNHFEETQI